METEKDKRMSENKDNKINENKIEALKAAVSSGIFRSIFQDIKNYSPGAKKPFIPPGQTTPITQKKWWLNFEIGGHSFKEFAPEIRRRVIYMWNCHPDRPEGYNIRWSKVNEIEIECVE